jgi:hypothetical protein
LDNVFLQLLSDAVEEKRHEILEFILKSGGSGVIC